MNGKSRADIIWEYDLMPSAFNRWIYQIKTTGSLDNLSDEAREIHSFQKHIQLGTENEILKQATLIMSRK